MNKLAYDLKVPFATIHIATWNPTPASGEIVVFDSPKDGTLAGQTRCRGAGGYVKLVDNTLIINGQPSAIRHFGSGIRSINLRAPERRANGYAIESPFGEVKHAVMSTPRTEARGTFDPVTSCFGRRYFMLGDNRDNSRATPDTSGLCLDRTSSEGHHASS